jgi:hypothetical protein
LAKKKVRSLGFVIRKEIALCDTEFSLQRRCELVGVSRSTMYYRKKDKKVAKQAELIQLLRQIHEGEWDCCDYSKEESQQIQQDAQEISISAQRNGVYPPQSGMGY